MKYIWKEAVASYAETLTMAYVGRMLYVGEAVAFKARNRSLSPRLSRQLLDVSFFNVTNG